MNLNTIDKSFVGRRYNFTGYRRNIQGFIKLRRRKININLDLKDVIRT